MELWFLLYGGHSEDGRGDGHFVERTTDTARAREHVEKVEHDPYSTGSVMVVSDHAVRVARTKFEFDYFVALKGQRGHRG